MNTSSRDAGIPVLTEIIEPADAENLTGIEHAAHAAPAAPAAPVASTAPAALGIPAAGRWPLTAGTSVEERMRSAWTDTDWHRLEMDVRDMVLRQTLERIDSVLEQRIRDSLADVLQLAVGKLADEIRDSLRQSLEETITHAVAEEINILRSPKI